MKIAIRYYTRSKKGNTQKLAEFISNRLGLPLVDISSPLEEKVDALILANALYAANIDGSVKDFLAANKDNIGKVYNVCSSASGSSTRKSLKKTCDPLGIELAEEEFSTPASFLFMNKDRPNEDDFKRLGDFLDKNFPKE